MKIKDRIIELRRVKASELLPSPKNWRTHPQAQQDAMRGILAEVGIADAVLARETPEGLMLIDGHLRADVAPDTEWPVLVLDVDEAEADLILATHDPLAAMATADLAKDAGLYQDKQAIEDEVPEPPADPITKPGDLWLLGDHRVLCGDSTKAEDVGRLMAGAKADAVLTDPPYGINQPGVPGDAPEELGRLIGKAVPLLPVKDSVCVAFQSTRTFPVWLDAVRAAGHKFERILSLYKEAQCTFPWRGWILKSESILVSSVGNPLWQDVHPYQHDAYKVSEVSHEIPDEIGWHGSIKPIRVVYDILSRIAPRGSIIFDGFIGSGTTLIAAEQLTHRCYGLEIFPAYCDVIVKRWENLTGNKATLDGPA